MCRRAEATSRWFCSIMNTWKNILVVAVAVDRPLDHHVLRALNFGRRRMPGSSGLRTIESISYVFLRFSLSRTLQSPKPWGPYPCWPACIPVRFDLNQGTFRLAGPRGHTSVRIQWPRWLHARWRLLLDRLFSFQSREACLCLPCHTCKRHSNKLLCGGACRVAARLTAGLVHVPSRTLRMRFTGRRHATPPCTVA